MNRTETPDGPAPVGISDQDLYEGFDWPGWYRLDNGCRIRCDEYIGSSRWEKEWEGFDPIPDGAVYYEIYDDGPDEIDGGLMGYMRGDTFADLIRFVEECGQGRIVCRIADPEEE